MTWKHQVVALHYIKVI